MLASGTPPIDLESGKILSGDIEVQTEAPTGRPSLLKSAGTSPEVVVMVRLYAADAGFYSASNRVYTRLFPGSLSSRTFVPVASQPMEPDVEIGCIALTWEHREGDIEVPSGWKDAMHIHHVNIFTKDLASSVAFYRDALGLRPGERPNFPFPGAWLYDRDKPAVHLNEVTELPSEQANAFNHVAFYTDDFDAALARLEANGVCYYGLRSLPDGTLRQCFMRDPNGITVEVTGP